MESPVQLIPCCDRIVHSLSRQGSELKDKDNGLSMCLDVIVRVPNKVSDNLESHWWAFPVKQDAIVGRELRVGNHFDWWVRRSLKLMGSNCFL